jgi:hypothetical protein
MRGQWLAMTTMSRGRGVKPCDVGEQPIDRAVDDVKRRHAIGEQRNTREAPSARTRRIAVKSEMPRKGAALRPYLPRVFHPQEEQVDRAHTCDPCTQVADQ